MHPEALVGCASATTSHQDQRAERSQQHLVLASASPRRRELLAALGLAFAIYTPAANETPGVGESPAALAKRLSLQKARVAADVFPDALIIAADTLVVIDGQILGKPSSPEMAFQMLSQLRGRRHSVFSGLTLLDASDGRYILQVAHSAVIMRVYSDREIRRYIASGDPLDKAGAYAIQHADFAPIAQLDGCYANVMGLPLCYLYQALSLWHVRVPIHPLVGCPLARVQYCPWARDILIASEGIS